MDREDILDLDLSALDASAASNMDRSHSAPMFLDARYTTRTVNGARLSDVTQASCICAAT